MSQIGYMVLAAGLGPAGYAVAIMHLLTHGFFKAGLFLGAGSVMHGMDDETDMRRYGGLRNRHADHLRHVRPRLPGDHRGPAVRRVLLQGRHHRNRLRRRRGARGWLLGGAALLGAGITAFYMTRVMLLTFFGERRWNPHDSHPHESPSVMTAPMVVLAIGSVGAGALLAIGGTLGALAGTGRAAGTSSTTPSRSG